MTRILIDLTDIESWNGHHGGTQRVVYGLAKQYYLQKDNLTVEFMAFSENDSQFYKTSFEPIFHRTEAQAVASPQQSVPAALSLKSRVKHLIGPYVPEKVRTSKHARVAAKKAIAFGKGAVRRARQTRGQHQVGNQSYRQKISFTADDTVLILGKPWDYPNMERALTNAKTDTGFKLVQVIYDVIIPLYPHLHHPSLYKNYTQYMFEAIYNSDLLLPISTSTDKDLKQFATSLNLTVPKTKVIRLADEITGQPNEGARPDVRIADKFIGCVGTIEIRKNHTLLYYAYKLAEEQGKELPQLVIVGSRGWLTADFQYLVEHDPKTKDKIIILDNVNDQSLAWVYANATLTVYPSFYEGWGLPVAEALAKGKICVASNASSIPEIGGDIIDYFSPFDAQACLDAIVKNLDPVTLEQKESQIKKNYKSTNWDDTYSQVNSSLNKL